MTDTSKLTTPLSPMTSDVAVRPEADSRRRFLERMDDVRSLVDDARTALTDGRWTDRRAIEDVARGLLLLVDALESYAAGFESGREEVKSVS